MGRTRRRDNEIEPFDKELYWEWIAVCRSFRRVAWVKQGGRKLVLSESR